MKYFEPKINKIAERYKFHSRQQKSEETVSEYIVEIRALSQTCDFGNYLLEALRDQLIFGVGNKKIQSSLLREKDLTFDETCALAKSIELANNNSDLMQHDNNNTVSVFSRDRLGSRSQN